MYDETLDKEEKIQRYLGGQMSEEEAEAFRQEAEDDKDLGNLLQEFKNIALVFEQSDLFALSQQIRESTAEMELEPDFDSMNRWEQELKVDPPTDGSGGFFGGWSGWLLGGLLVVAAGVSLYFLASQNTSLRYQQYLSPIDFRVAINEESPLYPAKLAYEDGQYRRAARILEAQPNGRSDSQLQLYLGICYLLSNKPEEAVAPLEIAQRHEFPLISTSATWYLSIALLESGRQSEAIPMLEQLAKEGPYAQKATDLLQELSN